MFLWGMNPEGRLASRCLAPCSEQSWVLPEAARCRIPVCRAMWWGNSCCWLTAGGADGSGGCPLTGGSLRSLDLSASNMQTQSSGRARLSSCREYRVSLPKQYKCSAEMSWLIASLCPGFPHTQSAFHLSLHGLVKLATRSKADSNSFFSCRK